MNIRIINKIFPLVAFTLLAASCGEDETAGSYGPPTADGTIRFEIGIAPAGGVAVTQPADDGGAPQTRVGTDLGTAFTSAFQAGDQVGLYIVKGDGELLSSGNYVDNLPMTYDGSTWAYTLPAGKEYYPDDGDPLSFYAYYPYNKDLADPLAIPFSVPTDQSTFANFSKGHLLMATRKDVTESKAPVQLDFSHRTVMLKVKLTDGANAWEKAPRPADAATLIRRYPQATLNLATGGMAISAEDTRSDIKMYRNPADGCWYAMLAPAQAVNTDAPMIEFEWKNLTTLRHTPKNPYVLIPGEVKPLDITISIDMTDIDPNHAYAVGDAYPYKGFDKKGVVFEVSNGGKNGKIVSLDEQANISWSKEENVTTNATSTTDGLANMKTIADYITANKSGDWSSYPVFAWVHNTKNGGKATYTPGTTGVWYLPSIGELQYLLCVATGNTPETWYFPGSDNPAGFYPTFSGSGSTLDLTAFNAKLTSVNGTILSASYHPSSTEQYDSFHYSVDLEDGNAVVFFSDIDNSFCVARAIMAF